MSGRALQTWACPNTRCGIATNLQSNPSCANCQAPRPSSFREACAALPPVTLEDFLRRAHARDIGVHTVEPYVANGDLLIRFSLTDQAPRYVFDFLVRENTVTIVGHGERR